MLNFLRPTVCTFNTVSDPMVGLSGMLVAESYSQDMFAAILNTRFKARSSMQHSHPTTGMQGCKGREILQLVEEENVPDVEYPWALHVCGDTPGPDCMQTTAGFLDFTPPATPTAASTTNDTVPAANTTAVAPTAAVSSSASTFASSTNYTAAKYEVCIEGDAQFFGLKNPAGDPSPLNKYTKDKYPNAPEVQPDGIWVSSDGQSWSCECVATCYPELHLHPQDGAVPTNAGALA